MAIKGCWHDRQLKGSLFTNKGFRKSLAISVSQFQRKYILIDKVRVQTELCTPHYGENP